MDIIDITDNIKKDSIIDNKDTNYKEFIKEYKYEILLSLICIITIIYYLCKNNDLIDLFNNNSDNYNTYLSLTTIPERLIHPWFYNNLKNLMNLNGNYKVILNIPETFKGTGEKYIIPQNILDLQKDNLIINRVQDDYGPITKLLGTLMNNNIPDNACIMICDDDIPYYKDFVKLIYKEYIKNKNIIYTYCIPTIEGYKGFMFQKKTMMPILNIKRPKSCFRIDDDFIGEFIRTNKIPVKTVSYYGNEKKYNDYRQGFCNFDIYIHDHEVPRWRELKSDNRGPMIQQCRKDYHELNN